MNPRPSRVPSYRHHKPSGRAVVTLNGRDIYLGPWGSEESKAEYARKIAEWTARGRQAPPPEKEQGVLVKEVILAYYRHCEAKLVAVELAKVAQALRIVRELYGETEAALFNVLSYAAIRSK